MQMNANFRHEVKRNQLKQLCFKWYAINDERLAAAFFVISATDCPQRFFNNIVLL